MSDYYIIAVDRDGQPYIAHAWGQRGANANHKYISKIGEGAKARYFYTQEQLRAFQQGARQGAQNAANKAKEKASDAVGRARENSVLLNVGNQYRSAKQAHQNSKSSDPQKAKWGKEGYESNNTLGGKAYKAQQKAKETVSKTASKVKSEILENKADKLQKKADILDKKSFNDSSKQKYAAQAQIDANNVKIKALEEDAKASKHKTNKASIDKLKQQNDDLKDVANGNEIREKFIAEEEIKEKKIRDSASKSKFSEYTKGDKDFDDKNFAEKNRVGDSDFFMAKRPDGSTVILEEDMKWVLPKGVNPNDPAIKRALTKEYKAGSNEEWVKQVTEAIDDAVEEANKKK